MSLTHSFVKMFSPTALTISWELFVLLSLQIHQKKNKSVLNLQPVSLIHFTACHELADGGLTKHYTIVLK